MDAEKTIRLGIETLMEVVESKENIEICVVKDGKIEMLAEDKLGDIVSAIKKEKDAAEEAKKNKDKK